MSGLIDQDIPIDLGLGIDTKTASPQVSGKLLRLENASFNTLRAITRRSGSLLVGTTNTSGSALISGQRLLNLGNELLLVGQVSGTTPQLFSVSTAVTGTLVPRAPINPVSVTVDNEIYGLTPSVYSSVGTTLSGVAVFAVDSTNLSGNVESTFQAYTSTVGTFTASVGGPSLAYTVFDDVSGEIYQQTVLTSSWNPVTVAIGKTINLLCYQSGSDGHNALVRRSFDVTKPWAPPSASYLVFNGWPGSGSAGPRSSGTFGATTDGTNLAVAWPISGTACYIATWDAGSNLLHSASAGFGAVATNAVSLAFLSSSTQGNVYVLASAYKSQVSDGVQSGHTLQSWTTSLAKVGNGFLALQGHVPSLVGTPVIRLHPTDPSSVRLYYGLFSSQMPLSPAAAASQRFIDSFLNMQTEYIDVAITGTLVAGPNLVIGQAVPASQVWLTPQGSTHMLVEKVIDPLATFRPFSAAQVFTNQATYFVIDVDTGAIVSRVLPGQAITGRGVWPSLPSASFLDSKRVSLPLGINQNLASQDGAFVYVQGAARGVIDYDQTLPIQYDVLGQELHLAQGHLQRYDGSGLAEHGFHVSPEQLTVDPVTSMIDIDFSPTVAATQTPSTTVITFPAGNQMLPGDYWALLTMLSGSYMSGSVFKTPGPPSGSYYWYSVDGSGSDPNPFNGWITGSQVSVLRTDTPLQVAQKTLPFINNGPQYRVQKSAITTDGTLLLTQYPLSSSANASFNQPRPFNSTQCWVQNLWNFGLTDANGVRGNMTVAILPPGKFITGGQYFAVQYGGATTGATPHNFYVWFAVDGVGSDPSIGGTTAIKVSINSTDSGPTVAGKVRDAISSALGGIFTSLVAIGPMVYFETTVANSYALVDTSQTYNFNVGGGHLGTGDGFTQGSYQYEATYGETDAQGLLHRSAPSLPLTVVVPRGQTNDSRLALNVPAYQLTSKPTSFVEAYRTQANVGSTFYKLTPSLSPPTSSLGYPVVQWTDTLQDTRVAGDTSSPQLTSNEILYTVGGALQHDPTPPAKIVHSHNNRLWLAGVSSDDQLLWFSNEFSPGNGVSFSSQNTLRTDPLGGPITALGSLDDKLVIFKAGQVFVTEGDGPDSTGQNGAFNTPRLVSSEAGCVEPRSVVRTPVGLMFKSAKGIYFLDRAESAVQYIGAEVQAFNPNTITSAQVQDDRNQVRFTTLEGPTLTYDYFVKQWSIHTGSAYVSGSVDSIVYAPTVRGQLPATKNYYRLTPDGRLYQESSGSLTDGGSAYAWLMQTGWLKPAQALQGFGRVRKALFLGMFPAGQQFKLTVDYNYGQLSSSVIFFSGNMSGTNPGIGPYPATTRFATDVIQWRAFVPQQKVEAVRLTLEEVAPFSTGSSVTQLTNIFLEAAGKKGVFKVPKFNSAG